MAMAMAKNTHSRRGLKETFDAGTQAFILSHGRIILLSAFIGLIIGLSVVALLSLYGFLWGFASDMMRINPYLTIFLPTTGIMVAYLIVTKLAKTKKTGCGTHQLLEAYHYRGALLSARDTACKTIASAITIGFGGSAGLEGPSLFLGGGIASLIGQRLKLRSEELRLYLLCGAAAGLSAVFKAPLTGILFALEIPYQRDLAKEAFIPATFSSITAYLALANIMGIEVLFPPIQVTSVLPSLWTIFHAFTLGLLSAALGLAFIKVFEGFGSLRNRIKINPLAYPIVGGLMVGSMGLWIPRILGVGYETIHEMAIGGISSFPLTFLFLLALLKVLATSITLNCGGSGGLFIPSIYVGATLGAIYSKIVLKEPSEIAVVASMAAVMAATHKTLLSSVAFVAETTGPSSIIPTLIAAATGYFVSGRISFYQRVQPLEKPIEEEEALWILSHQVDGDEKLERIKNMRVGEAMTPNPVVLMESCSIQDALNTIKRYNYRVFPIVNHEHALVGYVTVEDLLSVPEEKRSLPVNHLPMGRPLIFQKEDALLDVAKAMLESKIDHAYVVSDRRTMRLDGVVASIDIVKKLL
jgi:CIC family chloride channel protein